MRAASAFLFATFVAILAREARSEYAPQFLLQWGGLTNGQFYAPCGVAVDGNGNLYVVDQNNNRVQKLDSSGNFLLAWGSSGTANGQFTQPKGIAVSPDGNIFVTDLSRVQKFDANGNLLGGWGAYGLGDGEFRFTYGIAVDATGNVYISDYSGHRVQKFDSSGGYLTQFGSQGPSEGQFNYPTGIAVDRAGNVYVADSQNHRVQKFDASGLFLESWGSPGNDHGQFVYPQGVAVDASDSVYVADSGRVQKFDLNGNFSVASSVWGSTGSGPGQFRGIGGIAITTGCIVYASDTGNSRVHQFACTGQYLATFGMPTTDSQILEPLGTACSPTGDVYVSDSARNRLQVFNTKGDFVLGWNVSVPGDIGVDALGDVYVVSVASQRIEKFTATGSPILQWGSPGDGPGQFSFVYGALNGLAIDGNGTVYVTDSGNHRIQAFTNAGIYLRSWGSVGSGPGQFMYPNDVAIDPSGNLYVTDSDNRRVQKFDTQGNFIGQWGSYGFGDGQFLTPFGIECDAAGAVYVVDVSTDRVQKFSGNGAFVAAWGEFGTATGQFYGPCDIGIDFKGDLLVTDKLNHRVQKFGFGLEPRLVSIHDVGNDQGRRVRLVFQRSSRDAAAPPTPILQYEAFRRIDALATTKPSSQSRGDAAAQAAANGMVSDPGILAAGWDYVGAIPAHGEVEYNSIAPTLADSTLTNGMHWSVFFVRAATSNPLQFFDSPSDSGYSVDNLAPQVPQSLVITSVSSADVQLAWNPSSAPDFCYFSLYRGADPVFQPDVGNRIAQLTGTSFTHAGGAASVGYYKLGATDFSGNESDFTMVSLTLTGTETSFAINKFAARLLTSNPARDRIVVEYDLPATMPVALAVFDVAGRLLRRVERPAGVPAGRYSWQWDVRAASGSRLAAGVYFVKVTTPQHSAVLKALVMR